MLTMLKIELNRALKSRSFYVSLLIGIIISIAQIIMEVISKADDPLKLFTGGTTYPYSVFNSWIGGHINNPYQIAYLTIFPILATLPFGISYHMDLKKGYVKNVYTRTNRINYCMAKYISTFLLAGTAVVLPMLINLMVTSAILPSLVPATNGVFSLTGLNLWSEIFYVHPYLYIGIYMIIYFIYGGVFASLALAGAFFVDNVFLLTLFPFIIYYGLGIISPYIYKFTNVRAISPAWILNTTQPYTIKLITLVVEGLLIGLICFVIFLWKGVKHDTL